jgi:hypothetical protein
MLQVRTVHAVDFWQYPEMADRNAFFIGVFPILFTFDEYFDVRHPEIFIDYLLPFGLPFSIGASIYPVDPERYSIGLRIGYHINFDDEKLDVYFLYAVDLISQDEYLFLEFGGRFGLRRMFGEYICFTVESSFLFRSIFIGVSIKVN